MAEVDDEHSAVLGAVMQAEKELNAAQRREIAGIYRVFLNANIVRRSRVLNVQKSDKSRGGAGYRQFFVGGHHQDGSL
jgi:hypothetical protein